MPRKKVVVAMSGGVDSSTALAMLQDEGYDCVGVSMQLWDYSRGEDTRGATAGSCCSLNDIQDARAVADRLNVPFYVVNMQEAFTNEVVDYFVKSYVSGSTPNPCIKCNQVLKFDLLLKKALALEADFLATGHYARVVGDGSGHRLFKGVDRGKDQSYFLFTLTEKELSSVLFPLGGLTKEEVRKKARAFGLKTSEKKESQEICFVEEPGYSSFLLSRIPSKRGEITDMAGRVIGEHSGLFNFTVGQRKGLNIGGPGGPLYVIRLDTGDNRLVVGPESGLYATGLVAGDLSWISKGSQLLAHADGLSGVTAKIRYGHEGAAASLRPMEGGRIRVEFKDAQRAISPGQAVVFYSGEEVLGGGWIERAVE